MSGQSDPYIRIYLRVRDDPRFEHAYSCDACWAAYSRLLMDAEAAFPASASLPANLDAHAAAQLMADGIIEPRRHGCFVVHGMVTERRRRSEEGRANALRGWNMRRARMGKNGVPMAPHIQQSKAPHIQQSMGNDGVPMLTASFLPSVEELTDGGKESVARAREDAALEAYQRLVINVSPKALKWLDDLVREYGQEWTTEALGTASLEGTNDLLGRTKTLLVIRARDADKSRRSPTRKPRDPEEEAKYQENRRRLAAGEVTP